MSENLAKEKNLKDKDLVKLKIKDKELSLSVRVDKDIKMELSCRILMKNLIR